jgi:uncharacterized protein with GYD domain
MISLLLLMRADSHASLRLAATGREGAEKQVAAIESIGGSVSGQWALLGHYDLAVVATFPNEDVAAAYCLSANAAGYETEAHVALRPEQLEAARTLLAVAHSRSTGYVATPTEEAET